ncbi:hypothetical protein OHA72_25410 [Dactylosporangium sp. NBC_01737]|uniref:hypothetical protein n=1 Tax=Dactylosporangium sp. NBC_01737 TaxID=2975959 RepID=UPI002E0D59FE|nr:hypothetical protein OHA72_25410 [Dactylosporangium sp. NBC_01737]
MPDPLFQTLFDDTDTASWAPAGVVRERARRRTRRARAGAVAAAALAVAVVAGGVAFAGLGPAPVVEPGRSPAASSKAASSKAASSKAASSKAASSRPVEPVVLGDDLFLTPADVDPEYRIAAEGEAVAGSWTYESRMGTHGCQPGAQIDQLDRRDRSLVRGPRQNGNVMSQRVSRYRPGDAARYLQQVRDRVAACPPGGGRSITIGAQRFAGEDALLLEDDLGVGAISALVLIRQGDLVTQYEVVFDRDAQATLVTARKAADRLCAGTPAC